MVVQETQSRVYEGEVEVSLVCSASSIYFNKQDNLSNADKTALHVHAKSFINLFPKGNVQSVLFYTVFIMI